VGEQGVFSSGVSQESSLEEEGVQVTVVVQVEEGSAGAGDLWEIELAGHTVTMKEVQSRAVGLVGEERGVLFGLRARRLLGCRCCFRAARG